jgi:predicted DsbA family dithiol-disulfide isomerase
MTLPDKALAGASLAGNTETPFYLDVVSDTICPWCYVGKCRLAAALPLLVTEGLNFEIT